MYNISDAYIQAIRATTRQDNLVGRIEFPDGTIQQITTRDIGEKSVSITKQCIDRTELMFGGAILSELDISIRTDKSRYIFYGAKISLTYQVLADSEWLDVPLGIYNVTEADRTGSIVKLVAYDNLQLLDITFGSMVLNGTPFDIFEQIADNTGIELGFTAEDIETWANVEEIIQIDTTSGCDTYRDAAKIIGQLIGCFVSVDRQGKLILNQFQKDVSTTITKYDRYKVTIADYLCSYIALNVTGLKGTFSSYSTSVDTGLVMNMNDAPAWDYGLEGILQARADALFAYLEPLTYTPSDISMPGDPSIDCGDRILLTTDDGDVETLVTKIEWSYHDSMKITSSGINPYIEGSTATNTKSNRILSQESESNKMSIYNFVNHDDFVIGDTKTQDIGNCDFAAVQDTSAIFIANIKVTAKVDDIITTTFETVDVPIKIVDKDGNVTTVNDADGNPLSFSGSAINKNIDTTPGYVDVKVTYLLNELEVPYYPTEHLTNGEHMLALFYPISAVKYGVLYNWRVLITANGGTLEIPDNGMRATIFGQNLATGTAEWDGKIEVTEAVDNISLSGIPITTITEALAVNFDTPNRNELTELIANISLGGMPITSIEENSKTGNVIDVIVTQQTVTFSINEYTTKHNSDIILQTKYLYVGYESTDIDRGKLAQVDVLTTDKATVSEIEVIN